MDGPDEVLGPAKRGIDCDLVRALAWAPEQIEQVRVCHVGPETIDIC